MAFADMLLVGNSSVYDLEGFGKAILARIAHLIISYPEEDEQGKSKAKPNPDAGWCTATQDYIAAFLGCSEDVVQSWCQRFIKDGWLESKTVRNHYGHNRNYYRWKDGAVNRLEQLQMKKTSSGRFIRASKPSRKRATSFGASRQESGYSIPDYSGNPPGSDQGGSPATNAIPAGKNPSPLRQGAGRGVRAGSPACVAACDDSATATHTSKIKTNPNTQTSGTPSPNPCREDFSPSRTHPGKGSSNTTQVAAPPRQPTQRDIERKKMARLVCPARRGGEFHSMSMGECRYCHVLLPSPSEWHRMRAEAEDFIYADPVEVLKTLIGQEATT